MRLSNIHISSIAGSGATLGTRAFSAQIQHRKATRAFRVTKNKNKTMQAAVCVLRNNPSKKQQNILCQCTGLLPNEYGVSFRDGLASKCDTCLYLSEECVPAALMHLDAGESCYASAYRPEKFRGCQARFPPSQTTDAQNARALAPGSGGETSDDHRRGPPVLATGRMSKARWPNGEKCARVRYVASGCELCEFERSRNKRIERKKALVQKVT